MKIETSQDSEKQSQMLKLLQFSTVMIFVDSRRASVVVPDHLKGDYQLRLNFDYAYEVDDFRVLPDRLEASLSFNHRNFFCVIPFEAIYLMVSHTIHHGVLFVQSIPVEMLEYFAAEAKKEDIQVKKVKNGPALNVISNAGSTQTVETTAERKPRKRAHLRVVK